MRSWPGDMLARLAEIGKVSSLAASCWLLVAGLQDVEDLFLDFFELLFHLYNLALHANVVGLIA
jgi:hypothetical protein